MASMKEMYQCQTHNCGYVYDPGKGDPKGKIASGTAFKDLPDIWNCPFCQAGKKLFRPLTGKGSTIEEGCTVSQCAPNMPR